VNRKVQILQNSVWSNAKPFTMDTLSLTSINPTSGVSGTAVTFTGTGFGASLGSGVVWLGSVAGQVVSWSDTQVVATVAFNALTGIARIQQNNVWSNSFGFTVPTSGGNTVTPAMLNMVVGDTHTIQATSAAGLPATGLTWTSSDPTVVSLSTDYPPILTAVAPGHVTITAGTASADVTVSAGALALGTVIWSNPGDGSGVSSIVPAVPSPTGVADVFAFQNDSTVQAITSDGTIAWTADVSQALNYGGAVLPDFQGGLVVFNEEVEGQGYSIVKLDGITGQSDFVYTPPDGDYGLYGWFAVHTDGTIFAVQYGPSGLSVIGIDTTTGTQKFSVPIPSDNTHYADGLMIAGDGYAYVPYTYVNFPDGVYHTRLLRIGSDGDYSDMPVADNINDVQMVTNADQGILLTWFTNPTYYCCTDTIIHLATTTGASLSPSAVLQVSDQYQVIPVLQAQDGSFVGTAATIVDGYETQYNMISFDAAGNVRWYVPNDQPQIATADGGVIGQSGITYDQNGNATGQTAAWQTFALNYTGATGQAAGQYPGWLGNVFGTAYSTGSGGVSSVAAAATNYATTFAAIQGGNASGQGTAIQQVLTKLPQTGAKQLPNLSGVTGCYSVNIPWGPIFGPTPTCGNLNAIELLTTATPDSIFQTLIQTFAPVTMPNPTTQSPNSVMTVTGPGNNSAVDVTLPGQTLTISLKGYQSLLQKPFQIMTERFDPVAHTISVVTLAGHPLAGWRYWRVYSIGTNDVVIETGAYDQPGPGPLNYAGYYVAAGSISRGWQEYMQNIQFRLQAPQGSSLRNSLGGIQLRTLPPPNGPLLKGYWDWAGDFTQYILNNVCQSTSCN
jgi:hypothetical protein